MKPCTSAINYTSMGSINENKESTKNAKDSILKLPFNYFQYRGYFEECLMEEYELVEPSFMKRHIIPKQKPSLVDYHNKERKVVHVDNKLLNAAICSVENIRNQFREPSKVRFVDKLVTVEFPSVWESEDELKQYYRNFNREHPPMFSQEMNEILRKQHEEMKIRKEEMDAFEDLIAVNGNHVPEGVTEHILQLTMLSTCKLLDNEDSPYVFNNVTPFDEDFILFCNTKGYIPHTQHVALWSFRREQLVRYKKDHALEKYIAEPFHYFTKCS